MVFYDIETLQEASHELEDISVELNEKANTLEQREQDIKLKENQIRNSQLELDKYETALRNHEISLASREQELKTKQHDFKTKLKTKALIIKKKVTNSILEVNQKKLEEISNLKSEISNLKKRLNSAQQDKKTIQKQYNELKDNNQMLSKSNISLAKRLEISNENLRESNKKLKENHLTLDKRNEHIETLKCDIKKCNEANLTLQQKISTLTEAICTFYSKKSSQIKIDSLTKGVLTVLETKALNETELFVFMTELIDNWVENIFENRDSRSMKIILQKILNRYQKLNHNNKNDLQIFFETVKMFLIYLARHSKTSYFVSKINNIQFNKVNKSKQITIIRVLLMCLSVVSHVNTMRLLLASLKFVLEEHEEHLIEACEDWKHCDIIFVNVFEQTSECTLTLQRCFLYSVILQRLALKPSRILSNRLKTAILSIGTILKKIDNLEQKDLISTTIGTLGTIQEVWDT